MQRDDSGKARREHRFILIEQIRYNGVPVHYGIEIKIPEIQAYGYIILLHRRNTIRAHTIIARKSVLERYETTNERYYKKLFHFQFM
jgi:hypothetical protein